MNKLSKGWLWGAVLLLMACSGKKQPGDDSMIQDPHSYAQPQQVAVKHLNLHLRVDFENKRLQGRATWSIERRTDSDTLILDIRQMAIERVTLSDGEGETGAYYYTGEPDPILGRPLKIALKPDTRMVSVFYHTLPEAAALQWLAPVQTAGGTSPFLFTQSQAILARTWIPCQDSPGVRFTYEATVEVPAGLMALMSAQNPTQKSDNGVYTFTMPQPIPSYLLALAVGDIQFRALGPRSGVYAEPPVIEAAAYELADTEKMMEAAEKLYGPYRWGRYDVIILPPSFPFGGMENPRLTFATPTILAGDRSLVSLIAHELAHSWSGNLVTNANWNDFWLNEGFTTYFEHRIMEEVYGPEYEKMLAVLSLQSLKSFIQELGDTHPDTRLQLDLAGRDPDAGMSLIAYEKGHFFLRMLETHFGRETWDAFLRQYFETFAFQTMTSERFVEYLREKLLQGNRELERELRIQEWVFEPGLPENYPRIQSAELAAVDSAVARFRDGAAAGELATAGWTTQHWLYFLRRLPDPLSIDQMLDLDRTFHFSDSKNSEILNLWLQKAISAKYTPAYPALERFLLSQGRRKFLRPIYKKLAETAEGLELARNIYRKARPRYHWISVNSIDPILQWQSL